MKWSHSLASSHALNLVQSIARAAFAILVLLYLTNNDTGSSFNATQGWILAAIYVLLQTILQIKLPTHLQTINYLIDILAIAIVTIIDPATIAFTLSLLLIVTVAIGLLFSHQDVIYALLIATATGGFALWQRDLPATSHWSENSTLFIAALLLSALYFLFLLSRKQAITEETLKAAWNNPRTGLISQRALVNTTTWLLPLHDRMGMSLSIVLLRPTSTSTNEALANLLTSRIRHSDISGHFDDAIALLLPGTPAEGADVLLNELHRIRPIFSASVMTLNDGNQALEPVLHHLRKELRRAQNDHERWLVHASRQL